MNRPLIAAGRPLALAAALAMAATPALAQTQAGIAAAVRNKVELRGPTRKAHAAQLRERIFMADQAATGAASQLQILLMDRTTFTVGANARVTIDRFVYDPNRNARQVGVSVAQGAFRFMSGRAGGRPSGSASVRTPVATIGIRGTIFEGVVGGEAVRIAEDEPAVGRVKSDKGEASLIVLRGPGARTQGDAVPGAIDVTAADRTVVLDAPELAVYVPRAGAAPIGPFHLSPAGLEALQSLLRTTPPPAAGGGGNHTARNVLIGAGVVAAGILGGKLLGGGKKRAPAKGQTPGRAPANPAGSVKGQGVPNPNQPPPPPPPPKG